MNAPLSIRHVLVVEDSAGDIGLIHQALIKNPSIVLHYVVNAVQARSFLMKLRPFHMAPTPHLILLDLNLPIFAGTSVLPLIKEDPALRHVKVVILTSSDRDYDREVCRRMGADDYILKPSLWSEWESRIIAVVRQHCDGLEPDPAAGAAVDGGEREPAKDPAMTQPTARASTSVILRLKDGRSIALKEETERAAAIFIKAHFEQWLRDGMTLSVANAQGRVEEITPRHVMAIEAVDYPK